jgi:hypothetical protein
MLRDGKFQHAGGEMSDGLNLRQELRDKIYLEHWARKILARRVICVRADSVLCESLILDESPADAIAALEDIRPPFGTVWLEWLVESLRLGCYVERQETGGMDLYFFCEGGGDIVGPISSCSLEWDSLGRPAGIECDWVSEWWADMVAEMVHVVCEAFTRMNTSGTAVLASTGGHTSKRAGGTANGIVWHEIVVPRDRLACAPPKGEPGHDRRAHWVRAHRADYREGNGLFGRIKALIWMSEHRRGNEAVGEVIPTYIVKGAAR